MNAAPYLPVPVRLTVCGRWLAPSWTFSSAMRVPVAVGLNRTSMKHRA